VAPDFCKLSHHFCKYCYPSSSVPCVNSPWYSSSLREGPPVSKPCCLSWSSADWAALIARCSLARSCSSVLGSCFTDPGELDLLLTGDLFLEVDLECDLDLYLLLSLDPDSDRYLGRDIDLRLEWSLDLDLECVRPLDRVSPDLDLSLDDLWLCPLLLERDLKLWEESEVLVWCRLLQTKVSNYSLQLSVKMYNSCPVCLSTQSSYSKVLHLNLP